MQAFRPNLPLRFSRISVARIATQAAFRDCWADNWRRNIPEDMRKEIPLPEMPAAMRKKLLSDANSLIREIIRGIRQALPFLRESVDPNLHLEFLGANSEALSQFAVGTNVRVYQGDRLLGEVGKHIPEPLNLFMSRLVNEELPILKAQAER